ncbi:unnamed protein product [Amaranthus hypochondriacus]
MATRGEYRIFVGGLGWNTSQRHLEDAFGRYGKVIDCLVMSDRETGRPRGFGFITFTDRRSMEDAIRDMHGREMDGRVISVNKAEPRLAEDPYVAYGGDRRSGGRESYRGVDRLGDRSDECFKCGRVGHWARDCPSGDGGRYSSHSEFGRSGIQGDRDYDHYYDRSGAGHNDSRDRLDSREGYGSRDRYSTEKYAHAVDRFASDRFMDRYAANGKFRDRDFDREVGIRGGDRYAAGGPTRYDKGSSRDRAHPYDAPRRRGRH